MSDFSVFLANVWTRAKCFLSVFYFAASLRSLRRVGSTGNTPAPPTDKVVCQVASTL